VEENININLTAASTDALQFYWVFLSEWFVLYIHVTVHWDRFPFNNQLEALIIQIYSVIKRYMFRATSLPIIRS
jgi:hypothetical protein